MKQISHLKSPRNRCFIKTVAVLLVITAIIFVSWLCFRTTPEPIPRDIRILIDSSMTFRGRLLNIKGNSLEVITFISIYGWDFGYGRWGLPDDNEMLDKTIFDDFSGTITRTSIVNSAISDQVEINDYRFPVLERWTTELSENQLHDIWLLIDDVVNKYKEPPLFDKGTGWSTHTNVIIDDKLYRGEYYWDEYFLSRNFKFSRRDREVYERRSDINLLKLTHHIMGLIPEELRW